MSDLGRSEPRHPTPPAGRQADIERGDQPRSRLLQRRDQPFQIIPRQMQVAVGNHQDFVLGGRQHVDQVADLAIGAVLCRIDDNRDVPLREAIADAMQHLQGRVVGILNAEDDLKIGIALLKARDESFLEKRLVAAAGLENGNGRKCPRRIAGVSPGEAAGHNHAYGTLQDAQSGEECHDFG